MMVYRNIKVNVISPDGDILSRIQQGDILAPYLFIICLDYVFRTSTDLIKENGVRLKKKARSRRYPAETIMDADYADNIALLANTLTKAESLLHNWEQAVGGISFHVNANKTEYVF